MKKGETYIAATLITGFAIACLFALPAFAAEPAPAKGMVKMDKSDLAAARQKLQAASRAEMAKGNADFQAKRADFQRNQKAQLDSRNAQTRTEMSRLKTRAEQIARIRAEADQLNTKYAAASPAEKARMDRRAGELTAQLKNLGY